MTVCRALLISAAIDSVTSVIASIVRKRPSDNCSCCTSQDGKDLDDGLDGLCWPSVNAPGRRDTEVQRAHGAALRDERNEERRVEARPEAP